MTHGYAPADVGNVKCSLMSESKPPEAPTYHAIVTAVFFVLSLSALLVYWMSGDPVIFGTALTFFFIFLVLGIYALIGGYVAKAARRKGRSFHAFFWLSVLINPLIMAIVVAAISPREASTHGASHSRSESVAGEIERLTALRDSGAISDAEFTSAKARLLES